MSSRTSANNRVTTSFGVIADKINKSQFNSKLIVTQHSYYSKQTLQLWCQDTGTSYVRFITELLICCIQLVSFPIGACILILIFCSDFFLALSCLLSFEVWTHKPLGFELTVIRESSMVRGQCYFIYIMLLHFAGLHKTTEFKNEFVGWQESEVKRKTTATITGRKVST